MKWLGLLALVLFMALWATCQNTDAQTTVQRARLSWYGNSPELDGQPMANGQPYNKHALTVAVPLKPGTTYPMWPIGTRLRICAAMAPGHWLGPVRCRTVEAKDSCPGCGQIWPRPWLDASIGLFRALSGGTLRPGIIPVIVTEVR